ncbi:MAG TPA: class C sortase, partial [Bacillota bacterium]|nr:class C sortase [Bacillota bacterium]
MKTNKRVKTVLIVLIFIIGLGLFLYPIITNYIYDKAASRQIKSFDREVESMVDEEITDLLNLAHAYNDFLSGDLDIDRLKDPYTQEQMEAGVLEYARMLEVNEQIGHVLIPKICLKAPLYAGTKEAVLQKGIGHMEGTSLPVGGNYTHSVLTAHRGLPKAKLFTDLPKMELGDKFYIKNLSGTLAYQVDQIKTVEPTDFSDLAIVPGYDYATLLTCTPYMINSHRLLVRGHRIEYVEAVMESEIAAANTNNRYKKLFFITLILLIALA